MRDMYEWLKRAVVFTLVALALAVASDAAFAGEVTTGFTVKGFESTSGEHYEFTWYTEDRDWRWGVSYTTDQRIEDVRVCDTLGSLGPICQYRDLYIEDYPSAYVQRVFDMNKLYVGIGVAVHPERDPLLSAEASFRTSVGFAFDQHWSVELTHMSNAGLASPNWGQDVLLIRYAW